MDASTITKTLVDNCVHLAYICVIAAIVANVVMAILQFVGAPAKTTDATKNLVEKVEAVPSAADISKVMDSAKALIESLTKASPLVAWLAASVFFMCVAAFSLSDYAHKPVPSLSETQCPPAGKAKNGPAGKPCVPPSANECPPKGTAKEKDGKPCPPASPATTGTATAP